MTDRDSGGLEHVRVLDLFAGAGGLSAGLHGGSRRFRTIRAVESDMAAAATYEQNFGPIVHAGSVENWLRSEAVPEADLVVGGPPCQGFSMLGRRDPNDIRNTLWRDYVEVVRRARPRAFVLENVPTFLTSGEYAAFDMAFGHGELADYLILPKVLDAADYGSPQHRRRVIVIGVHRDLDHPGHPTSTHNSSTWVTVRDALRGIRPFVGALDLRAGKVQVDGAWLPGAFKTDELHFTSPASELAMARYRSVPYGGSRVDLPDELSMNCWRKSPRSATDVMGRLVWERPSVTIRTEFFKPEKGRFLHPTQHRPITHHEASRLQGFPDDYRWVGTRNQIARQIGNAVPLPLGEAIGRHLIAAGV